MKKDGENIGELPVAALLKKRIEERNAELDVMRGRASEVFEKLKVERYDELKTIKSDTLADFIAKGLINKSSSSKTPTETASPVKDSSKVTSQGQGGRRI